MAPRPSPDADTLLAWEDALERLGGRLPPTPDLSAVSEEQALEALADCVGTIRARSGFGRALLAPLSLDALTAPRSLLSRFHISRRLPAGMYARSQPYRGRIELSPPSEAFWDPRERLRALCQGRLPLELRALQHELTHLRQVDARRELAWLVVLCVIPPLWPVLVVLFFARIFPPTAAEHLAAQEIQAHLSELELDADPVGATARTIVALSPYPFTRHLAPGALEGATALIQALRTMDTPDATLAALFRSMPPRRGLLTLAHAVQRACAQRGWDERALRRAVRRRELLLLADQLVVKAAARTALRSPSPPRAR